MQPAYQKPYQKVWPYPHQSVYSKTNKIKYFPRKELGFYLTAFKSLAPKLVMQSTVGAG